MDLKVPQHVAIVMDGNGRWAANRGLARVEGHKAGVEPAKKIIAHCLQKQIPCLSLFAFSSENWSRPAEEVNFLMELLLSSLKSVMNEFDDKEVQMRFTGDRTQLSEALQQQMQIAEDLTKHHSKLILNLVFNYGGKWDILTAAKKMARAVMEGDANLDEVNESSFDQYLETWGLPDPDLFIRTSGELRISNFFLWQLAYTELYFTEINWPDFNEQEFELALEAFRKRQRRFGQISGSS